MIKPIHIVFCLLLIIAGVTGYVIMSEPPVNAVGAVHETHAGIFVGGDGAGRLETIGRAPYYFQIAVILLASTLLYMGIPKHRRDNLLRGVFAATTLYSLFVWQRLYSGYEQYLETGTAEIVFGFPVPTNWFIWGIWSGFVVFVLLYFFGFRRYFLHPDDEKAFQQLIDEKNENRGEA